MSPDKGRKRERALAVADRAVAQIDSYQRSNFRETGAGRAVRKVTEAGFSG
jgi:hypothetical protein